MRRPQNLKKSPSSFEVFSVTSNKIFFFAFSENLNEINAHSKKVQLNVQHLRRTRSLLELVKSRLIDQNLTLDHYFSLMMIMGKCLRAWPDVLICHLSRTQCIENIFKFEFEILCFKDCTTSFQNFQISLHIACFKSKRNRS